MEPSVNQLQCRYFIGVARPRFWLFGKPVVQWHEQQRDFFYDALRATNLLARGTDVSLIDVMLAAGDIFIAGPYHFKGVAK